MNPIAILTAALGIATAAVDVYGKLKTLWGSQLTPEQSAALAAEEERLFASPAWQPSGKVTK